MCIKFVIANYIMKVTHKVVVSGKNVTILPKSGLSFNSVQYIVTHMSEINIAHMLLL